MSVFKRLYRFIWQYKWPFIIGSVPLVLSIALSNLSPLFVKWLTENVQTGQLQEAFRLLWIFAVILLLSNLLDNLAYFISDKNMVRTSTTIAKAVLAHIHKLDFAYHTNKSSGKLISLMKRGDDAFYTYYDIINRQFLQLIISFVVMATAFAQLSWYYLLFVMLLLAVTFAVARSLIKINIQKRKAFNDADDDVSAARVDNLVNFDTVKYFANEEFEQRRFAALLKLGKTASRLIFSLSAILMLSLAT